MNQRNRRSTRRHNRSKPHTLEDARSPAAKRRAALEEAEQQQADFERRKRAQLATATLELDHVDAEILRLMLQHPKITQQTIGDIIGLSRRQVNVRIHAGKFQRALGEANRRAIELFEEHKTAAARRLGELIDDPDPHVAIRACIAHLWPHIHATAERTSTADFVTFIEEAYERANRDRT